MPKNETKALWDAKTEAFCKHYVNNKFNGTQAALDAGYSTAGAHTQSHRLLKNATVKARIQELLDKKLKRVEVDGDQIILGLKRIMKLDPRKLYGVDGNMLPPSQWPDEIALCIKSVETIEHKVQGVVVGKTQKVHFYDKLKAKELLMRHKGMLNDKIDHTVKGEVIHMTVTPEQVLEMRKKILDEY